VCGVTRVTVFMGALMTNTDLTYDDLAEATTWMADRLLASQNENRSLSQKLAAVYGEVAALRCALEFEQESRMQSRAAQQRRSLAGCGQ
jgi:hypothetical protein